uniref:Uncharacterized protein n=2 Tax=Timspurckia oligopyrenoides TaxID=708627 RepID=A0A6T6NS99_9RHOD|mmetsp:Transcript_8225/g.14891  ORF Transcript_8225/g.14891 Transcript_8225/m.14891 type:complete len:110 (+) Transcript_8225:206-535(+)
MISSSEVLDSKTLGGQSTAVGISASIWTSIQAVLQPPSDEANTDDRFNSNLEVILIECEDGKVALAPILDNILCIVADRSVDIEILSNSTTHAANALSKQLVLAHEDPV